MNLPETINFTNGTITFLYDANGNKLSKTVSTGVQKGYLGGIEYNNGAVEAVYHEEGRVTLNNNIWQYEYSLKDHLGNTRVIFTDSNSDGTPEIIQESDYYPFGMQHASNTTARNHYLYNGKELNEDLGLDWYDYGFRWYDAQLGRFPSVDPIIENFPYVTPYNYAENKPINSIDLWGLQSFPMYYGTNGTGNGDAQNFAKENPKTATAIAVAYIAIPIAIWAGPQAVVAFLANEVKDEALSRATGGVSDYADVTKMSKKVITNAIDTKKRADELHDALKSTDLPEKVTNNTVIGVAKTKDGGVHVSTNSSMMGRVKDKLELKEGESFVGSRSNTAHAEENLIHGLEDDLGKKINQLDASSPMCKNCADLTKSRNINTNTPTTGKPSRNRRSGDSNQLDLFDN